MLPVSGAEQFITSGPKCPAWARTSAITPYCEGGMNQLKALCTVPLPQHLTKEHQTQGNELCSGKDSKDLAS